MAAPTIAAMPGVVTSMQAAATTGNGTVLAIPSTINNHNFMITGSAGIGAGAVTLETSNDPTYSGTWAQVASPITVVASAALLTKYTGLLNFVRARISTTVTGGTVNVDYQGEKTY